MHQDYQAIFLTTEESVRQQGFALTRDESFQAAFTSEDGWRIVLDGDRVVRPSFNLLVRSPEGATFVVRLLMKVFQDDRKPSLDNQLDFLKRRAAEIFVDPPSYQRRYDEIDTLE